MFKGVATALITPFNANGIDYENFAKLIEHQIANGIDALLVCGTTGEPATMTSEERLAVKKFAIKQINGRVPVIIGTGSNCTADAVASSIEAEQLGADYLLVVTPYYNKCSSEGLFSHYEAINNAVKTPIITYNVPGRTSVNITPDMAKRLSSLSNVVAIKDAAGNIGQTCDMAIKLQGTKMEIFSGDDGLILPMLVLGASGLISVASNVIPKAIVDIVHSYLDGNIDLSQKLFFKYRPFFESLFVETNPIPCKYACSKLSLCENVLRLPLCPISTANEAIVDRYMQELGVTL